jgi:putative ABC transport system permease protein
VKELKTAGKGMMVRAGQSLLDSLKSAFTALRVNKMRSGLTMLGIVIGVSAVIMLVSLSLGAKNNINKGIEDIGTNLVMVVPGKVELSGGLGDKPSERRGGNLVQSNRISPESCDTLQKELPAGFYAAAVMIDARPIKRGSKSYFTQFIGTNEHYPQVRGQAVAKGEFFSRQDRSRRVAVLGSTAARELFGEEDPLGKDIVIGAVKFKVIGVLEEKGRSFLIDNDDIVLIPFTQMRRYFGKYNLDDILVTAPTPELVDEAKRITEEVLSRELGPDEFTAIPQSDMLGFAGSISRIMTYLVVAIASISLLVGGIGIMNIMLVSVTERTREIGLRKAVGAKARHIMAQFVTEAVVLSFSGGSLGVILAVFGSRNLGKALHIPAELATWVFLLAFGVSVGIGLFFGVFPAWRASRLQPIEALRQE